MEFRRPVRHRTAESSSPPPHRPARATGNSASLLFDSFYAEPISKRVRARRAEARRAAEVLASEYLCLEFQDLSISIDTESRRRVTEAVRRLRPDIVLTAPPVDYMSDHEMTSRLVRDACFNAPIASGVGPTRRVSRLER